ncbi:MAG: winged helix-turn-helix domain-containing protein [Gemmatimonadetes bacterium]|nr:winged helix-turn-helix domain-containing protein [Gemmatimonadota bacterium]
MSLRSSTPIQPIRLHVLGGADLRHPVLGRAGSVLAQPKRFALLAYLALANPGAFSRRDTLLALFWPESDTERARSSLRSSLHSLRKALGDGDPVLRLRRCGARPGTPLVRRRRLPNLVGRG